MTSDLVPAGGDVEATTYISEDAPVIIILIVCIVGIFLLALNIGLILFFVCVISDLVPAGGDVEATTDTSEDAPVIIILIVCIVGIFLLALNIGLILFFVRRRKKRLESKCHWHVLFDLKNL